MKYIYFLCLLFSLTSYGASRTGELDTSFGTKGLAHFGSGYIIDSVKLNATGKELALLRTYASDFTVIRLSENGAVDLGFGVGGSVTHRFDVQKGSFRAEKLLVTENGKVLVALNEWLSTSSTGTDLLFMRLNADGSKDTTYGTNGSTEVNPFGGTDYLDAILRQSDGKTVIVACSNNSEQIHGEIFVFRLTVDGMLDKSFGTKGFTRMDILGANRSCPSGGESILADDDSILIGVTHFLTKENGAFLFAKLTRDGHRDLTFGKNGNLIYDEGPLAERFVQVTKTKDKSFAAAGSHYVNQFHFSDLVVIKFSAVGTLDPSFGQNGKVIIDMGSVDTPTAIEEDSKQRMLITAVLQKPGEYDISTQLARLLPNGQVDTQFGVEGISNPISFLFKQNGLSSIFRNGAPWLFGSVSETPAKGPHAVMARLVYD